MFSSSRERGRSRSARCCLGLPSIWFNFDADSTVFAILTSVDKKSACSEPEWGVPKKITALVDWRIFAYRELSWARIRDWIRQSWLWLAKWLVTYFFANNASHAMADEHNPALFVLYWISLQGRRLYEVGEQTDSDWRSKLNWDNNLRAKSSTSALDRLKIVESYPKV